MTTRFYSTVAVSTTLTAGISDSATTMTVGSTTGYPSAPFYLGLEFGLANQEVVEVTDVVGLTLTVTRGVSGTTAVAHNAGSTVVHVAPSDFYNDTETRLADLEDSVPTESQGIIFVPASSTSGSAINDAIAALPANGGKIVLGAGTHTLDEAVAINKDVILEGNGVSTTLLQFNAGSVTTAIAMADTTQRRVNIRDLRINTTTGSDNTGTAINASYFFNSTIERVWIGSSSNQTPNKGIVFGALGTYYNAVRDCRIGVGGASSVGIQVNSNSNDNAVYSTKITGDSSTTCVQIGQAHSTTLVHVTSDSVGCAIGVDLQTSGHDTTMVGCYFEGMGIGLKVASGVESARYIGGYISTSSTANIQDNGAVSLTVDNSWVEFNPYSSIQRTGVVKNTINGTPVPGNTYQPSDFSCVAWNFDPAHIQNTTTLTNGTLYLMRLPIRYDTTITNLLVAVGTAGITPTAGQSFLGLYNSAGTRVATTADAGTALTGTSLVSVPLTAPYAATAGEYWVAILVNFATAPFLCRASGQNVFSALNLGAAAASRRFAVNGTALTALPASITPSSNANPGAGQTYWVGCN